MDKRTNPGTGGRKGGPARAVQLLAALLSALLVALTSNVAFADDVHNSVSTTAGATVTMTAGGSAKVNFYIQAQGNDGEGGCNASPASPATLSINVVGATATPSSLTFTACRSESAKAVTFNSTTTGDHAVTVSVSDTGPGTYDSSQAAFTLRVNPGADSTPPVLTPTIVGTSGQNGWYTSDVSVSWTAADKESAVTVESGCAPASAPNRFTTEGMDFSSSCTARSAGGTATSTVAIKIDKSGPSASLSASGNAGSNGWFTGTVTVATNGEDMMSGPVTCTPEQHQATETRGAAFNGSCTNRAGLTTQAAPLSVKLDTTGPSAQVGVSSGTLGANGWYTSDVAVTVDGDDSISGPVTCIGGQTLTADSPGVEVGGSCTNGAGLSAQATPRVIKIDKSNPTANLQVAQGAEIGSGGWYTSAVTVQTVGGDNVSDPLTCTGVQSFDHDTASVVVNGSCTNDAGRTQHADALDLKIDTTPPVNVALEVVSGTEGDNGWYVSAMGIRTIGADPTSDVTCSADQHFSADTGGTVVNGSCTNGAGLTTHATPMTIKIDTTGPTANLAVTAGTEGANGWYTSDVTVSTTGADSLSGPAVCTGNQSQATETGGTAFEGYCTNMAGLRTGAVPLAVKLDKTAPSAEVVAAGTEGANGWFTGNVTVTTSGADAVSGPVTCDEAREQNDETAGTEFPGSCRNQAGLSADATPVVVKLDKTAPSAVLSPAGRAGANGWFIDDVAVSTGGTDSVSGPVDCTPTQHQVAETTGEVFNGICKNRAGLSTDAAPLTVKLDKTAPTSVILTPTGTEGENGWYTSDVTIATTGVEDISTPFACDGPQIIGTDTAGTPVNGSCTNAAGLTTNAAPVTVKIDKSDPNAHLAIAPGAELGRNGWYVSDVTVKTLGSDNVSDPVTCTGDKHLAGDTGGTEVTGSCTNHAGRNQAAEPITVKIDKTAPVEVALAVISGEKGAGDWYTSAVQIGTTGSDPTSGVSCTADQSFSGDTRGITVTGSCTNGAGLVTHAAPLVVKIDTTAPTAVLSVVAGEQRSSGWYVSDVTVRTSGEDSTSGVTCSEDQFQTLETRSSTFTGICTNGAGVVAEAPGLTVKLDKTGPSASLAVSAGKLGANDWYVTDVTVSADGDDDISGPVTCTGDQNQSSDTEGQSFEGACTNSAGLSTGAEAITIKLDKSKPDVSVTGVENGKSYTLGSVPASGCSTLDRVPGSGVQTSASLATGATTNLNKVGVHKARCDGARDNAGNEGSAEAVYTVTYGAGSGIRQPINPDNTSMFSRGRAVPVKFRLPGDEANGGFDTTGWRIQRVQVDCSAFDNAIGAEENIASVTPSSLFRYDSSADQYINNADFRDKAAGTCWKVKVTLDEGTVLYSAVFKLQK